MRIIYKHPLEVVPKQVVVTHKNACVVDVGYQNNFLYMWVEQDAEDKGHERHNIRVYGTGYLIEQDGLEHLKTVHSPEGFVWHVYWAGVEQE